SRTGSSTWSTSHSARRVRAIRHSARMNVRKAGSALPLASEPRSPWLWKKEAPEPGVTYVFGVGPVPRPRGPRTLRFGLRGGKLEALALVPDRARPGARRVVLGRGLPGPGTPLPAEVREARALAALALAWAPVLRDDLPPELVQRILEVSEELHTSAPW